MNEYVQLLKGILEGLILKIISYEETYGYEIVQTVNKKTDLNICEGTIYPLLLRAEKNNWVSSEMRKSELGPMRKYYKITNEGIERINKFKKDFEYIQRVVYKVWED